MAYGGDAVCNAGVCQKICDTANGMVLCSGACVDTQRDVANCGGCGVPCSGICTGGVCDPTGKQIIATAANAVDFIIADGTSVFWIDSAGNVMQVDRNGLTAPITLATGQQSALPRMAVDSGPSGSVYWINTMNGGVWRAVKGTPGAILVANVTGPRYLAVNSGYVYFDDGNAGTQGYIYRIPKGGGTTQTVIKTLNSIQYFDVDDTYLWYINPTGTSANLFRASPDGTNVVQGHGTSVSSQVWHGGGAVVVEEAKGPYSIFTFDPNTLTLGPLLYGTTQAIGNYVSVVAADATYAYFGTGGPSYNNWPINNPGIFRSALCGGPPERITTASGSAIDDQWLYWPDSSGAIHRYAK
jgi:hypothetical protein